MVPPMWTLQKDMAALNALFMRICGKMRSGLRRCCLISREVLDMESEKKRALFGRIFTKIAESTEKCVNCLCRYCTHNAEELYRTVKLEEAAAPPCFNCDECREYTGDRVHAEQAREECGSFVISDYGTNRNRKNLRSFGTRRGFILTI